MRPQSEWDRSICEGARAYARATLRNALHVESQLPGRGNGVAYLMSGAGLFNADGLDGLRASIRAAQAAPDVHDEESLVRLMEAELAKIERLA